jgi:SAM-dependent methyltransferase
MSENLDYWNDPNVESMYDKHLLRLEIESIKEQLKQEDYVLDVGCGEGEGTLEYAKVVRAVHAIDFSSTRLQKAMERFAAAGKTAQFDRIDMLDNNPTSCGCSPKVVIPSRNYDVVISQRFLINLPSWEKQQEVLAELCFKLVSGGRLILLEGSKQGTEQLNKARELIGMQPIPVRWHNVFIDDYDLGTFMVDGLGMKFRLGTGFGAYFVGTRLFAPLMDNNHTWDSPINERAASIDFAKFMRIGNLCSRLKLWVFVKP